MGVVPAADSVSILPQSKQNPAMNPLALPGSGDPRRRPPTVDTASPLNPAQRQAAPDITGPLATVALKQRQRRRWAY